jgi:hypothetical protein
MATPIDYQSQPAIFTLGQSSTGRWGYRSGNTKRGLSFVDAETGAVKELPKATTYKLSNVDTRGDDLIPDGISLEIEYADMTHAEFVEAFTDNEGYAPPSRMLYYGIDEETGEPDWRQG